MRSLLWKEFKQLMPYAWLWAGLVLLYFGTELYTYRVDEVSYYGWCEQYCDRGASPELVLFSLLFSLIVAYGLFTTEYETGSIDFLKSLPLSYPKLFLSKVLVGWLFLCVLIALEHAIHYLMMLSNTQSISGKWYYQIDFTLFYRECLFALVILCHGVFISWFRVLGLLFYAAYLIIVLTLETQIGLPEKYNVLRFFDNDFYNQSLVVNWSIISFHLLAAALLLLVSYALWAKRESTQFVSRTGKWRKVWPLLMSIVAFFAISSIWLGMIGLTQQQEGSETLISTATEHYRFVYTQDKQVAMDAIVETADNDFQALSNLLDARELPMIDADMSSVNPHVLGLASWKKILLRLSANVEEEVLNRRVLSHETAHVFQSTESGSKLSQAANSVDFFVEGMAQYTSFSIVSDEIARKQNWLISAVAWDRQNISFDELANKALFDEKYDGQLLYGIGDVWVEALVQVCSTDILGNFLREHKEKNAPIKLAGYSYWFAMLGRLGCDLEQVNAHWQALLRAQLDTDKLALYPTFENIRVQTSQSANLVEIEASMVAVDNAQLTIKDVFIKVRSEKGFGRSVDPVFSGSMPNSLEPGATTATVNFSVNKSLLGQDRFEYQLGYVPEEGSRLYFDKWRSATVR